MTIYFIVIFFFVLILIVGLSNKKNNTLSEYMYSDNVLFFLLERPTISIKEKNKITVK